MPADVLAPSGAKASAATVLTKCMSCLCMGLTLERLRCITLAGKLRLI